VSSPDAPVRVFPSLLAADAGSLGKELERIRAAGADGVHIDAMDGNFVPNIAFGPTMVEQLRSITNLYFDVHLMLLHPESYVDRYADAGAHAITVHVEVVPHPIRLLRHVDSLVGHAGIAINPATPVDTVRHLLPYVRQVIIMSVDPGFSFQPFLDLAVEKVREVRNLAGSEMDIVVDGGIAVGRIAERLVDAGATVLVAGNATFGAPDLATAIAELRAARTPRHGVDARIGGEG
jgi:ribulose-phosphate 3-epimerase